MGLRECGCALPIEHISPNKKGLCVKCGYVIPDTWTSNDDTMGEFFNRLEECVLPIMRPGDTPSRDRLLFWSFRDQCLARERAGRRHFGHRALMRDNIRDAKEEFADGANYMVFHALKTLRAQGEVRDIDAILRVARQAWKAWRDCQELARVDAGEPAALDLS